MLYIVTCVYHYLIYVLDLSAVVTPVFLVSCRLARYLSLCTHMYSTRCRLSGVHLCSPAKTSQPKDTQSSPGQKPGTFPQGNIIHIMKYPDENQVILLLLLFE